MRIDIKKKFPIVAADDEFIINRNGELTLCYKAKFQSLNTYSKSDLERLLGNFRIAYTSLLDGIMIHAQTMCTSEKYSKTVDNEILASSFLGAANERMIYEKSFKTTTSYLYFTLCNKSPLDRSIQNSNLFSLSSSLKKFDKALVAKFKASVEHFLTALGTDFNFEFNKINNDKDDLSGSKSRLSLSERFLYLTKNPVDAIKEISFNEDGFSVGNKVGTIFSIDNIDSVPDFLPLFVKDSKLSTEVSEFPSSLAKKLIHTLDADCIWNVFIFKESRDSIRNKVTTQIKYKTSLSGLSAENQISKDQCEEYLDKLLNDSYNPLPISLSANLIVFTEKKQEMNNIISDVDFRFKNLELIPTQIGSEMPSIFWNSIPGNASNSSSEHFILTFDYVAASLMNWEETDSGMQSAMNGYPLVNRLGARVVVDIFAESGFGAIRQDITGYNGYIIGPTGSGKSVLLNYLTRNIIEKNGFIILVDVGHSYRMLCKLYGGEYIEFSDKKPLSFNPFIIDKEYPSDRDIMNIKAILSTIWKDEGAIETLEESIIESSIRLFYSWIKTTNKEFEENNSKKRVLRNFNSYFHYLSNDFKTKEMHQFNSSRSFNIDHFLDNLRPFFGDGQHGKVLNADRKTKLTDNPLIVFELSEIGKNPLLNKIVMVYIMSCYDDLLKEKVGFRKYLFIEEAWKAIMNDKFSKFILEVYKTARKSGGTIMMVTQEPDDLMKNSAVGNTIVSQSDIKFILNMSKYQQKRDEVKTKLGFNDGDMDLLYSLNGDIPNGVMMREVFIKWNTLKGVYGVLLSEEEYWTYTTEEREKYIVIYLLKNVFGDNLQSTIAFLAETQRSLGSSRKVVDEMYRKYDIETKVKLNSDLLILN